jgi:hypothetical protein
MGRLALMAVIITLFTAEIARGRLALMSIIRMLFQD